MDEDAFFGIITLVFVVGVLGLAVFGTNAWSKSQLAKSCSAFSRETGRETRYVEYTYWSYDCLTKGSNGLWISTDNLREVQ